MLKKVILSGLGAVAALALLGSGFAAGRMALAGNAGETMTASAALDRPAIEKMVRDYLVSNPDVLAEMQTALDTRQKEQERLARVDAIRGAKSDIFNASYDGVVGNPNGKTTIVEFYDYNCGYCRHAQDDMLALTAADPDLRFVLKEFPILGPDSQKAHVVSMALRQIAPDKYVEFHNQLLGSKGRATEAAAIKIAVSLGVDEDRLREAMKDPAIVKEFDRTYDLANKLAITGTPSYVVGDEVVYGALGKDVLTQKIAAARTACADAAC